MKSKNYIIQISDTHLFGAKNSKINGANSYLNLKHVLNQVSNLNVKPDLIVVSGDLSQDCTFESYQHLANLLSKCNVKYCLLPGNHDDINIINRVFDFNWVKGNIDYSLQLNDWLLYLIDTSLYPEDAGHLSNEQFLKFENILNNNKHKSTIVFMHHHPVEVNSSWIDNMILKEANRINNVIKQNPQVKAVLFGHIHQVFEKTIDGVFYGSAPSTCYQVLPKTEMFTVEKIVPGYRIVEIENEKLNSKVVWVE